MAVRRIISGENPILRSRANPVEKVDSVMIRLLEDMVDTMYEAKGVGLAAPQVGIAKRLIVVDAGDKQVLQLVNPEIVEEEGSCTDVEGCLSMPGVFGEVPRALRVKVKALDKQGRELTVEAGELLARILQHEIDHLNGILFVQRATRILDPTELDKGEQ